MNSNKIWIIFWTKINLHLKDSEEGTTNLKLVQKTHEKIILYVRKKAGRWLGRVPQNLDSWFKFDFKQILTQTQSSKILIQRG